jgi:hypothetical protein
MDTASFLLDKRVTSGRTSSALDSTGEPNKKTGVVERPEAFRRAGLLFNEPFGVGLPGPTDLLFI